MLVLPLVLLHVLVLVHVVTGTITVDASLLPLGIWYLAIVSIPFNSMQPCGCRYVAATVWVSLC